MKTHTYFSFTAKMKLFCLFTLVNQIFSTLINSNVRHTMYGEVRGFISSRVSGIDVEEYLGVPYAAPPIGKLRFKVRYLLYCSLTNKSFVINNCLEVETN